MIESVIQKLCDVGAQTVARYAEVADDWPTPEHFFAAFILDHLGDEITMTMETNCGKLLSWNAEIRRRRGLGDPPATNILAAASVLGTRRVDLVLYEGFDRPKDKQDFWALVEIKSGWISGAELPESDRSKLLSILEYVDTCPYGVVCGSATAANREWAFNGAASTGDKWFESHVDFKGDAETPCFCARLFKRPAQKS